MEQFLKLLHLDPKFGIISKKRSNLNSYPLQTTHRLTFVIHFLSHEDSFIVTALYICYRTII